MNIEYNVYNYIIELLYQGKSINEISNILNLDSFYIVSCLKKIKANILYLCDESKFDIVKIINSCTGNKNKKQRDNPKREKLLNYLLEGKSDIEIMEYLNFNSMQYSSLLRALYYELYYTNTSLILLNSIKSRINKFNILESNNDYEKNSIISSEEDMLLDSENKILNTKRKFHQVYNLSNENIKFIVISDTHFGSLFENFDMLKEVYDYASKNNIKYIFHAGDLIEGDYSDFDRCKKEYKNIYSQIEHVINDYCYDENIKNYILLGNHDIAPLLQSIDMENLLSSRKDFTLLGYRSAYLKNKDFYISLKHTINKIVNYVKDDPTLINLVGHSHTYKCNFNNKTVSLKVPTLSNMISSNKDKVNRGFVVGEINYDNDLPVYTYLEYINYDDDKNYIYKREYKNR